MIKLGDKVKDRITGFTGIAIARTQWLHGCERITILPDKLDKDGQPQESCSFDEPDIELIKPKRYARKTDTGGPRPEIARRKDVI